VTDSGACTFELCFFLSSFSQFFFLAISFFLARFLSCHMSLHLFAGCWPNELLSAVWQCYSASVKHSYCQRSSSWHVVIQRKPCACMNAVLPVRIRMRRKAVKAVVMHTKDSIQHLKDDDDEMLRGKQFT